VPRLAARRINVAMLLGMNGWAALTAELPPGRQAAAKRSPALQARQVVLLPARRSARTGRRSENARVCAVVGVTPVTGMVSEDAPREMA